ncbi:MAG: recombinase [Bdellovibrionaceae bacterium]|nr:recombinase [Pseudobdellovibrionaceae bacterium]
MDELGKFVYTNNYARYNKDKKRRETFEEAIQVMEDMHKKKYFAWNRNIIEEAFDAIREGRVLASQRALQFSGAPIEQHNMRMYNCATSFCDRTSFFSQALYMGLCGSGVGFSVQRVHVEQLPNLITQSEMSDAGSVSFVVEDCIEGWARALDALVNSFFTPNTPIPEFDYSKVRVKGTPISSGGRAPGPEALENSLLAIEELLIKCVYSENSKLRPIDCFDIVMHAAEAVLSGGRRRAATIALFDYDDKEMLGSKTGEWLTENKHRMMANISAVFPRSTSDKHAYNNIFTSTREFGEPGIIFTASPHYIYNPCVEIGMCPVLIQDEEGNSIEEYTLSLLESKKEGYTYTSGWQVCNLTEINCEMIESIEDYKKAVRAASILGTLQAGYTDAGYLDEHNDAMISRRIIERESLIGVSMTGIMSRPDLCLDPDIQQDMARYAVRVNQEVSKMLCINPAARVTCVKPAGTTSILLGTSAGIHPHHSRRFIRRVFVNKQSPVLEFFKRNNPEMVEDSYWKDTDSVVSFPVEAKRGLVKSDLSAVEFLNKVRLTQENWVRAGTARPMSCEGLTHNVSNTINVLPDEWISIKDAIWDARESLTGIALLGEDSMATYPQLPKQRILLEDEIDSSEMSADLKEWYRRGLEQWNLLTKNNKNVDYTQLIEEVDVTESPTAEPACAGGACEI